GGGGGVGWGRSEPAEPERRVESGKPAARRGGLGPRDAGAIAGNRDAGRAARTPGVEHGAEAELPVVPDMVAADGTGEIEIGHDALMQQQQIGRQASKRTGALAEGDLAQAILAFG